MASIKDITNYTVGYIKVLSFSHREKKGNHWRYYWNCLCTLCGKETKIRKDVILSNNKYLSCKDCTDKYTVKLKDEVDKRLYSIYYCMHSRCTNGKRDNYKYYGERGIEVCKNWCGKTGFYNFYNDMKDSYIKHYNIYNNNTTLDRIDVNKNYCKENCRWATRKEQANNRR